MDRRTYLAIAGALPLGLAGCMSDNSSTDQPNADTTTDTPSPTKSATKSSTKTQTTSKAPSTTTDTQTISASPTRTPNRLESNPDHVFKGSRENIHRFEVPQDDLFAVVSLKYEGNSNLLVNISRKDITVRHMTTRQQSYQGSLGAFFPKSGMHELKTDPGSGEYRIGISYVPSPEVHSLPAQASGISDTVIGKYSFKGYTRITAESPDAIYPTVHVIAQDLSKYLLSGGQEDLVELSGEYFLQVRDQGPWKLKMKRE